MMQQWTTDYEEAKGVHINYQSVGSGAGIDKMSEEKVDFGCTDAPMSPDQLKKGTEHQRRGGAHSVVHGGPGAGL